MAVVLESGVCLVLVNQPPTSFVDDSYAQLQPTVTMETSIMVITALFQKESFLILWKQGKCLICALA